MSGDRLIRIATADVVRGVAGFTAVVSYTHIYERRARSEAFSPVS